MPGRPAPRHPDGHRRHRFHDILGQPNFPETPDLNRALTAMVEALSKMEDGCPSYHPCGYVLAWSMAMGKQRARPCEHCFLDGDDYCCRRREVRSRGPDLPPVGVVVGSEGLCGGSCGEHLEVTDLWRTPWTNLSNPHRICKTKVGAA